MLIVNAGMDFPKQRDHIYEQECLCNDFRVNQNGWKAISELGPTSRTIFHRY